MLRFPNPGSDIDSFIRIYQELFEALKGQSSFDLDDVSRVLVERNLATSSGYMGDEALRRSYNEDRSRDRLYNQSKMYSELYKALGWLHPTPEGALIFRFTYLGAHVVVAKRDPAAIFNESILGIAYPNSVLDVKGKYVLRPFVTILRTLSVLDGLLCRDEMIVGPLCLEDDTDPVKFNGMITELKAIRKSWANLEAKVNQVSRDRSISTTTMENYTRFPLAVLKWTGWTTSQRRKDYYGKSIPFLVLTDEGRKVIRRVTGCRDIRAKNIQRADQKTRAAIVRAAFYQMLDRAGFDTSSVQGQLAQDLTQASTFLGALNQPILFSPFQELDPQYVQPIFPQVSGVKDATHSKLDTPVTTSVLHQLFSQVTLSTVTAGETNLRADNDIVALFRDAAQRSGSNLGRVADLIAEQQRGANKGDFYPFVARLFRALGYNCEYSRPGVNYQRWDAIIIDKEHTIPIEIKSPGEEEFLSVKAVRQALENKVILLSRKSFPTQTDTTSLVVGYNLPNDRSEVASLIADIHKAFNITIGVIDLRSLLRLVAATVLEGKAHNVGELRSLYGIIRVTNA